MIEAFKKTEILEGDFIVYYHFIGTNMVICIDDAMDSITIINKADNSVALYNKEEYINQLGTYFFGNEDFTVEEVIKKEYAQFISNTDFPVSKRALLNLYENKDSNSHKALVEMYSDNIN